MMKKIAFLLLCSLSPVLLVAQLQAPKDLRTEYLTGTPLIDIEQPRLGWINEAQGNEKGQKQTAYEIRVSETQENLMTGNVWSTGKVLSSQNQRVEYRGKTLKSTQQYWWQVRTWDKKDKVSEWSAPTSWRMGLLEPNEWKAVWIGAPWQGEDAIPKPPGGPQERTKILPPPAPYLRKGFDVNKPIQSAVVFTTGLGYFEFYVNGELVSDDKLVPNQTNYSKRPGLEKNYIGVPDKFEAYKVFYLAYDLTDHLKSGKNAIGAILGNGFYNAPKFWTQSYGSPRFIAQLQITYDDGTTETIISDSSWKAEKSPILMDLVYDGEIYDARKAIPDWASADFDDRQWQKVIERKAPFGELRAHTAEPDKVTKTYQPTAIEKLGNGHYKVQFPEEISGWVRLNNVEGPAGQKVHITFNGNLYSGENTYYFAGKGKENYAPRFNWFVFSGIEITGWPGELKPEMLTAEAVNTDVKENAFFETSNPLFNQINDIWKRSQMDNMHGGIASDCPHRERSGYTGDGQVACPTVMHNFDARAFYQKWVSDMREARIPETGYVPNGAPWQPGCGGGVAWGAAINIIPWEYYLQYGDHRMLSDNYDAMKGYLDYMETWITKEGIMYSQREGQDGKPLKWWNLGDWAGICTDCLPDDALVHTFYYWYSLDITVKVASILDHPEEALEMRTRAIELKNAFHRYFYDEETMSYGDYGSNIFALKMGVPADRYSKVKQALIEEIERNNGHLNTAIFGTRFFFEVLAENGLNHLAYEAMNKRTEPGFGHWIELGGTTSREHWDESGSHNHPMFGGGLVWLYRNLAGLNFDESKPGYEHLIFKPLPAGDLQYARYETETPFGTAGIHWEKDDKILKTKLTIPVGSNATFYPPEGDFNSISVDGHRSDRSEGIEMKNGTFELQSGVYNFSFNP
ncbi:family 78 glycoside hydrolase catalytic domain [Jiulongibacter sediminis]|uniref:family 78 glycoside hydrolase catalytic domain n=1 Tax=Jiulongibacter sediminis TaxID=1605367 RepID=UPI0006DBFC99|nr:family 78 glycoside hydrolase catalytic domain [Jiulongibacter sediminis]